jgi:hypothetical protein
MTHFLYIYFGNLDRDTIGKLFIEDEDKVLAEFRFDEEDNATADEMWERCTEIVRVVKLSADEFESKRWFIAFGPDHWSPEYFQTDEEPMKYISNRFVQSRQRCEDNHDDEYICRLLHREDIDNNGLDIEMRYCDLGLDSIGDTYGLRIVNANRDYPKSFGQLKSSSRSQDISKTIFVFDTQQTNL